jgi:hypothetical protein
VWPSYQKNEAQVIDEMTKLVEQVMEQVGRNLVINNDS